LQHGKDLPNTPHCVIAQHHPRDAQHDTGLKLANVGRRKKSVTLGQLQTMSIEGWAALAAAYVLGAMSPGPSLAIVLRNTVAGGRPAGLMTGFGHGIGFGIYAFAAALGLAAALAAHETTEVVLRWGGTAMLLYLAYGFARSAYAGPSGSDKSEHEPNRLSGRGQFFQGFGVAMFNPKILAWMLAIYAPLIDTGATLTTLLMMALLGLAIDASWYMLMALVLSSGDGIARLRANAHRIDGAMGLLMALFAAALIFDWL
jgi:threonine/homoserine/homoserine lactone efflux protein